MEQGVQQAVEHAAAAAEHGGGQIALLFLIIALAFGAAIRHLLRRSPIPYTVALLVLGLILGALQRAELLTGALGPIGESVHLAANIDPHLILFVFLPTLIFEAAFAMDVHIFRRSFANILLLAVPGLLVATFLTGAMLKLYPYGWTWPLVLMGGALLSATDPVAVVALLKELGASKKLATIVEGESLFNDGTAIVVFMVFFLAAKAGGMSGSAIGIGADFLRVAIGGILLGLVIAGVAIAWVRRVFNDALVEITVTVAAAYLTFYVAEEFLHVSGVLGLVALGLVLAGVGRTRISPEVEGFLHHFWELAAYIANTLIFILVGVVIAVQAQWGSPRDWLLLILLYVGIHIVRAMVIAGMFPIMRRAGYGMSWQDATMLWWGGLRGAVGLALGLVVAQEPALDAGTRGQVLFLTAGIVTLTLLVNATTVGRLSNMLGLNRIPAVKELMLASAMRHLQHDTEKTLNLLKSDRFLSGANWERVRTYIPSHDGQPAALPETNNVDLSEEARRRILEAEKAAYWRQFEEGLLNPDAVRRLVGATDEALDRQASLDDWRELEANWEAPGLLRRLQSVPVIGNLARPVFADRLALGYDVARGYVVALEDVSGLVPTFVRDRHVGAAIREQLDANRERALTAVKDLREAFPEMVVAIETRTAARSVLNHERHAVQELLEEGVLEEAEAERLTQSVETRMKQLFDTPPAIQLPEPQELLREVPWLSQLPPQVFQQVLVSVQDRVFAPGDNLVREGDPGDSLFVIARGSVKVLVGEYLVDLLGPGNVIGEMAVLTGALRTATVQAETTVTALWLTAELLQDVMSRSAELEHHLWHTAGARFAENLLNREDPYRRWGRLRLRRWLQDGSVVAVADGESLDLDGVVILLTGEATDAGDPAQLFTAPSVLRLAEARFDGGTRIFVCPPSEQGATLPAMPPPAQPDKNAVPAS